jgi:pimeloyl-ACP methyl ester carboxylesterase
MKRLFLTFLFSTSFIQAVAQYEESGSFYSFDSTRIYYEVNGKGPAVLLIHGFIVNSESWKKSSLYADLIQSGFKVITLDLRGNGQSDRPHTPEAYEKDAEAKDVIALANLLQLKEYSVVGYSRGSIIASRVLLRDDRVDQAVLGGMGADFTNPNWPRRIMFYEALMGKSVKELEGAIKYIKEQHLDELALAYMQKGQPSSSKKELATIKRPVLVICGTEDEDNGSSKTLASLIPGSAYVRVPGNHNNTSRTKEFAEAVIAFIKKNKGL